MSRASLWPDVRAARRDDQVTVAVSGCENTACDAIGNGQNDVSAAVGHEKNHDGLPAPQGPGGSAAALRETWLLVVPGVGGGKRSHVMDAFVGIVRVLCPNTVWDAVGCCQNSVSDAVGCCQNSVSDAVGCCQNSVSDAVGFDEEADDLQGP